MPMSWEQQCRVMGRLLYAFAAWTVTIKFLLPMAWAAGRGEPLVTYIGWDAWWVAHIVVGMGLTRRRRGVWPWAMLLAAVETVIITTKFALFLPNPTWDFWHTNWLVNKAFMLAYFAVSLWWLTRPPAREQLAARRA